MSDDRDRLARLVHQLVSADMVARGMADTDAAWVMRRSGRCESFPMVAVADLEALAAHGLVEERQGNATGRSWQGSGQALGIAHQVLGDRGGQPMTVDDWRAMLAALEARC